MHVVADDNNSRAQAGIAGVPAMPRAVILMPAERSGSRASGSWALSCRMALGWKSFQWPYFQQKDSQCEIPAKSCFAPLETLLLPWRSHSPGAARLSSATQPSLSWVSFTVCAASRCRGSMMGQAVPLLGALPLQLWPSRARVRCPWERCSALSADVCMADLWQVSSFGVFLSPFLLCTSVQCAPAGTRTGGG